MQTRMHRLEMHLSIIVSSKNKVAAWNEGYCYRVDALKGGVECPVYWAFVGGWSKIERRLL